jgi:acetyl esterase/lipase
MVRLARLSLRAFAETLSERLRRGPLRLSWSFRFEWFLRFMQLDWEEMRTWPASRIRSDLDARPFLVSPAARRVRREVATLGGVSGEWFVPPEAPGTGALLYLHGGSYQYGSTRTHADLLARLALACCGRVFAPNFRLAPEHPFPAQLEDTLSVWRALGASGIPAERVVAAGESSGGHLLLALLIALRDARERLPAAAIVISPFVDLESDRASLRHNEPFDHGDLEMVRAQMRAALARLDPRDPRASPLRADLRGLCPLLVQVGGSERLLDDVLALAENARASGVATELDVLPEMPHAVQLVAAISPEGQRAIARAGAFARSHLVL